MISFGDDFLAGIVVALLMAAVIVLLTFALLPLRHPWTIEAIRVDDPKRRVCFAVKGWRRSRRAISALAEAIKTTGAPSALPEATPVPALEGQGSHDG